MAGNYREHGSADDLAARKRVGDLRATAADELVSQNAPRHPATEMPSNAGTGAQRRGRVSRDPSIVFPVAADGASPRPTFDWGGICLDCGDAEEMARFYTEVFGWEVTARDAVDSRQGGAGWICMSGPPGGPSVSFQAEEWYAPPVWPEVEGVPSKMMHFEVGVGDLDRAVELVVRAGGRLAATQPEGRDPHELRVVLDPAGHPFCLCR
jgi:catechol 2,3-dioxygenase-like lactoylglutathione lyase family enzyme